MTVEGIFLICLGLTSLMFLAPEIAAAWAATVRLCVKQLNTITSKDEDTEPLARSNERRG